MGEYIIKHKQAEETKKKQSDKALHDLIKIIRFTENVSTRIHGVLDEAEISRIVIDEFMKSKRYTASILLLTDDRSKLKIVKSSLSSEKLKVGEKATGLRMKYYMIDLNKSSICSQVVRAGKTVQVNVSDIIAELFSRPLAYMLSKITGYERKPCIITPLYKYGKITGVFAMSSTELGEYLIPSVRNLAQHISTALELADEHAERKHAKEALKASKEFSENLIASMRDGFSVVNKHGVHIDVNPALCQMTGFSREELVGTGTPHLYWPEEEYENIEKTFQKTLRGEFEDFELIFKRKNGERFPVIISPSQLMDEKGDAVSYFATIKDISERRKAEEELEKYRYHLEELVEERTAELKKVNEQLQREITERKKAEEETIRTKEHLQNIIDSASEIIISFDTNNRVTTWNKTAELLTGFKQREVIGRRVTKSPVFNDPQELIDNFTSIVYGKKHGSGELILTTKDNAKRILRASYSAIKSDKDEAMGILCVGKDITHDVESHGKLLKGNSYLISDKSNRSALEFFTGLTLSSYKGLLITRATPDIIKNMISSKNIQVVLLKQNKIKGFENIQDLDELTATIKEFSKKNADSIILLDRMDYLLTNFSFEKFTQTLYQINDIISENNSIFLFYLDPSLVDRRQRAVIENELQPLPNQKIEDIEIEDQLYDVLKFIYEQNQKNSIVSFKKVSKEFSIVSKTTNKRLKKLENRGLIFIKKRGRLKAAYISAKGKTLLHKRQIV